MITYFFFNLQLNFSHEKKTKILKSEIGTLISFYFWYFKNAPWNLNFNVGIQYLIFNLYLESQDGSLMWVASTHWRSDSSLASNHNHRLKWPFSHLHFDVSYCRRKHAWVFSKCFQFSDKKYYQISRTCHILCKRPRCHHSASKTQIAARIFKFMLQSFIKFLNSLNFLSI